MVSRFFVFGLGLYAVACGHDRGDVVINIVSLERDAIVVRITNKTDSDVVLFSPEAPTRRIDTKACAVTISTVIDQETYSFAFTPALRTVRAGKSTLFRANLKPLAVSGDCREWNVIARYAYLTADEVQRFRGRNSVEFHQYVLTSQRIATVSSKAAYRI